MGRHTVEDVRDIALVGHRAAGKTSLADALLYEAHAVDRLGKVDDGTSFADTDDDEKRHHFSIDTHVLHATHGGKYLNILDTPGSPDFIGAALEGLTAVETAVIVANAANAVEVNTRRMFREAGRRELSRVIVVNKIDAEHADFAAAADAIQTAFGNKCVPFNVPDANGAAFSKVVCVLDPPDGKSADYPVPPDTVRTRLIEAVIEADDALMEKYLTEGDVSADELEAAIPKALEAGTLIPIFCTSATKDVGVKELLDALSRYGLSPAYARRVLNGMSVGHNGQMKAVEPKEDSEFLGFVFKVVNDRYVGHLSFIRVLAGVLTPNHQLIDLNTGKSVRVGQLLEVQGKQYVPVPEAGPGDIVAVAKVDGLHIGDTVAFRADAPKLPVPEFPQPMFGVAIEPKTRGEEQKVASGLHKIAEEDPTVRIAHDPQTHELVMSGVSQLHLDVVQERLKHRFDVEVSTKEPKIPYRETVLGDAAGEHKHKKQTGGRGQFAEVHLRVYPMPRTITSKEQCEAEFANRGRFEKMRSVHYDPAHNFAFIDHIVGGTIPNNFIPAVEKGCKEMLVRGVLAGCRIQDVAVEVHFGKYHDVDSSEAAFMTAARHAFRKAFLAARPALLEPVVKMEVTAPARFTGSLLGDLATKRAHVENQDSLPGDLNVLTARAPLSEVAKYAAQLGGMTQGQGSYAIEFSHYEQVPAAVQQQVVAKANVKHEEE
jgi:elongation factor G